MKFNKIEISAFRIYENPINSVFDFSSNSGEVADFVSLYAPNGFGKTSFYDAVEWGITGSVNRFFIRNRELNKLEVNQSSQNRIPVLRNAKLERDTYVKVFSSSSEIPFENSISKDSTAPDLPLKKDAVSHKFHKVILSQEWISAFLTEKSGEQRYIKFMENPELSGINKYYLNLKHLFSHQVNEEKKLKDEIDKLNQKVKHIGEQKLLETINNQIDKINKICSEQVFKLIEIETTDKELIEIKDTITRKISVYEKEIQIRRNKIDNLRSATTGGNRLPSLKSFSDFKSLMPNILIEIKTIEELLKKFEEKRKTTNEVAFLQESLNDLTLKKEAVEASFLKYNQFEITNKHIKSKLAKIAEIQDSLPLLNEGIDKFNRDEISLNEQLKTTLQQIAVSEEKNKALPTLEKNINDIQYALIEVNEKITSVNSKIEPCKKQIKDQNDKLLEYSALLNQLQEAKYSKKNLNEKSKLIILVDELNQIHANVITQKGNLQLLNEKIEKHEELNSTLQRFIEQGLILVNDSKSSKCPLCEQPYYDFVTLASKISKNDALSDVTKELLSKKQTLIESISSLEEIIENGKLKLSEYYTSKIDQIKIEIVVIRERLESFNEYLKEKDENRDEFESRNAELSVLMIGMTIDEYKKQLYDLRVNEKKTKEKIIKKLLSCQENLKTNNEMVEKRNGEIVLLKQEKEKLIENTDYLAIVEYFNTNYPSEEIKKSLIDKSFDEYKNSIHLLNNKIEISEELLTSLKEELAKFNEENLKIQKQEIENKKKLTEDELNKYMLFFEENFDLDIKTLDLNEIIQYIENENENSNRVLKDTGLIRSELFTLDKNSEHISEFLHTERTKIEILTKEEELIFLESSVKPEIERERKNVKEFLEKRIKDFFYEKLINKLYSKIDPHPDFKEVEFRPNLDAADPRLDVFVKNRSLETIIPNLYFSTAQINILSLCIFLASALKSEEYDCIFIDDPIQSMDSINVLSTIDLLRSIIVNNDKQIIISTHDENFHNLLKKKMPAELFKSKFLKLESFGKVVNDV